MNLPAVRDREISQIGLSHMRRAEDAAILTLEARESIEAKIMIIIIIFLVIVIF